MSLLREPLLGLSRSTRLKELVSTMPVASTIVASYVAGETSDSAVTVVERLVADGLSVTLDYLGEDTLDEAQAEATVQAYFELLAQLGAKSLARKAEVSLKLSAIGQALAGNGPEVATKNAQRIAAAARDVGTSITIDAEDHTTTDDTMSTLAKIRKDFPDTGGVLQAYLHRSESDAAELSFDGSRIRLCKGAYAEPEDVAYQDSLDVDRAYVRCLKVLFRGSGYPMIATHDPQLIAIASTLASRYGRRPGSYEFQMLYGVRPVEQLRLAQAGESVRVYVPYGDQWYGYLMRRLAERPANLALFARSLITRS
jgi:proline dehydrogenase